MRWKNFHREQKLDFTNSWLITYSDMITIILCFFIVFFTLTAEEASMLENIKENLSTEVKDLSEENKELKEEQESLKSIMFGEDDNMENDDFISYLEEEGFEDSVEIEEVEEGVRIRFREGIMFDSGKSDVSDTGYKILDEISKKLVNLDNSIVVEGYTDDKPILKSDYSSNWELSADRAIGVAKYLIDDIGILEERISVSGYGEQKPIDSNRTEKGRANNRRIEITVLNRGSINE